MKKALLVLFTVMLIASSVYAGDKSAINTDPQLGVTYDVTYASKWVSRGSEVYSENGAWFNTIAFDLWKTGFGAAVCHVSPDGASFNQVDKKDKQRNYYIVNYANTVFEDESYMTKYKVEFQYKDWYDQADKEGDVMAWVLSFAWPELIGNGFTPKYVAYYDSPAGSGYANAHKAGWAHLFGLDYKFDVADLPNPVVFSSNVVYKDGMGGGAVDHDWAYATFGLGTKFKLAENLTLVPSIYHQVTMDDSVNDDQDETWVSLSLKYNF